MRSVFYMREVSPYRYGLIVNIGQSDRQLEKHMRDVDARLNTDRTKEVIRVANRPNMQRANGYVQNWKNDSLLRIMKMPETIEDRGTVVHELLHVVRACLKSRNIRMTGFAGQEAYCYLLEELHNDLFSRLP